MKKILFITSDDSVSWAFKNEIELLENNYECHVVSSLFDAQKIAQEGVDKVVMYPFYITWANYAINSHEDLLCFAGYYFWKQELADKKIPTIVVDFQMQIDLYMEAIMKMEWKEDSHVVFFSHNCRWKNTEELVELIKD